MAKIETINVEKVLDTPETINVGKVLDTPEKYKSEVIAFETAIRTAKEKRAKFVGYDDTTKMLRDMFSAAQPDLYAIIQSEPEQLEADLKTYKFSQMSQEQKDLTSAYLAYKDAADDAITKRDASFAALNAKYPQTQAKTPRVKKEGGAATVEGEKYTGKMLSVADATAKVNGLLSAGIISETEIIKSIYGIKDTYTRGQIHNILLKLGRVQHKA